MNRLMRKVSLYVHFLTHAAEKSSVAIHTNNRPRKKLFCMLILVGYLMPECFTGTGTDLLGYLAMMMKGLDFLGGAKISYFFPRKVASQKVKATFSGILPGDRVAEVGLSQTGFLENVTTFEK